MKVMRNADRLKVGAGSRRIALCRLRPFYGLRHASSFGFVHVARQGGWLLRHTMSGPAHEFIPKTAAPASDARLAALWRSVFSSKDGLFCRLFRLKFALVSGPRVYQLNAGIDVQTEKEFHELTEWLTATFQIWISIDLQNNFLKIFWGQLSVRDDNAAAKAEAYGIDVVMDRCPAIEYPRLNIMR